MLGKPSLAAKSLEAALAGHLSPRRRGSVHVHLAATGLQRHDLDQFLSHAETALRLAGETGSGYVTRRLQGIRPQLGAFASDQRVRDFADKIASMGRAVSEGINGGQIFRQAWIDGVRAHYPGEPKPGYVAPWERTPDWERQSAAAVFGQVAALLTESEWAAARLTRSQKGQFVAACWTTQIYLRIPDPKPAYVAPWEDLPAWQRETDADIFEAIEQAARADRVP